MASDYTVQNQRQLRWFDENRNTLVDGMEITFAIADGQTGTIRVPIAQFTPDNVRALIEARVAVMQAVNAL